MRQLRLAVLVIGMALAGCAGRGPVAAGTTAEAAPAAAPTPEPAADATGWRAVATAADRSRLRRWRSAWMDALAEARGAGHVQEIAAQGALFDPDRMLADPMPPAGDYRCRVFKLGTRGAVGLPYIAYPAFTCRIAAEGAVLGFDKLTGSQRPVGLIFPSEPTRAVFLGTLVFGDETRPIDYGQDDTRDMAGFVERVAPRRWRLVLPYPAFESKLDVIELVPVR